jgi:hypothetical protein
MNQINFGKCLEAFLLHFQIPITVEQVEAATEDCVINQV